MKVYTVLFALVLLCGCATTHSGRVVEKSVTPSKKEMFSVGTELLVIQTSTTYWLKVVSDRDGKIATNWVKVDERKFNLTEVGCEY